MSKFLIRLSEAKCIIHYCAGKILSIFHKESSWVLLERGTDARDNAYWLYRFIKEYYPERKVYYIIDKASSDYYKVREDAVQLGSLKSYRVIAAAKKLISTHYASGLPVYSAKLFRFLGLHRRFYFLQHGVTKDDQPMLYGMNAPMRLFVCGAKPEYDYIKETFRHPAGIVQYTGMARFDQLHDFQTKRQILIMPTWRVYINNEDAFLSSDYFQCWQAFLSNERLLDVLERNDLRLVFYVHYEMQPYSHHFTANSARIVIAKFEDYDVQTLLKESAVLVTDYSSVFFDFGYMHKPVVYYQFDEDKFTGEHYQRGFFDYRTMGFGDVFDCEEDAIESLLRICNHDMQPEEMYLERIDHFFPLYDKNNCQRIYDLIEKDNNEK